MRPSICWNPTQVPQCEPYARSLARSLAARCSRSLTFCSQHGFQRFKMPPRERPHGPESSMSRKTTRVDVPNDPVETSKGLFRSSQEASKRSPGSPWIWAGRLGAREGSMRRPCEFHSFSFTHVSSTKIANSEARRWCQRPRLQFPHVFFKKTQKH